MPLMLSVQKYMSDQRFPSIIWKKLENLIHNKIDVEFE